MKSSRPMYLSSLESVRFHPVRECLLLRRLRFDTGKDCALVRLDPPASGQDFGSDQDLDHSVVAARHEGGELFPINKFPLFIFVGLPRDGVHDPTEISAADVQVIGWGELYRTAEDARTHRFD